MRILISVNGPTAACMFSRHALADLRHNNMKKGFLGASIACSFLLLLSASPARACGSGTSTITNLPAPSGYVFQVNALNATGQFTGFFYIEGDHPQDAHAFRYDNGVVADLGTLGGSISEGIAINASGQVAGDGFVTGSQFHAFTDPSGPLVDLGTLGGYYSSPSAINNAGQIAGGSLTKSGDFLAFLYA